MARRTRQNFPQRSARILTNWARTVQAVELTVAAATKALLVTFSLSNPSIGETVRRTRGRILIQSDQTGADEAYMGAMGAIVITDLAIAAGAASIPGPVTDASDDGWFVWEPLLGSHQSGEGDAQVFEFDSKAMRRIEEGFGLAFMVENASATTGLEIAFGVSMLSSLS